MRMGLSGKNRSSGIALIMVMLVVVVLSMMAAGFAYSMRVELKLARNSSVESDMELLGRSGIELARYVLGQQLAIPSEAAYDAFNQKWAGGPGGTNDVLAEFSLENNRLGPGSFTVHISDLEGKVNINTAARPLLERALELFGAGIGEASSILDSIEDWRDKDAIPHLSGVESEYYLGLPKPYVAKDGPIDDLSELLLVRGITPELYWGPEGTNRASPALSGGSRGDPEVSSGHSGSYGLVDMFNTLGRSQLNINTASMEVLQLLPGVTEHVAAGIIRMRAGLDGVEGTEDDTPFHAPGELINVPGMAPQLVAGLGSFCGVKSYTFEARVDVDINQYRRRLVAVLLRNGPRDVQVVNMHWD